MKAGILTHFRADNFGAVLQAYALQTKLSELGLESEFIDLGFPEKEKPDLRGLPPAAAVLLKKAALEEEKRSLLFKRFRDENLKISRLYGPGDMELCEKEHCLFISGSDQVWNMYVLGADPNFFLPFAPPEKRFSYAASFGGEDLPPEMKDRCAELLSEFAALSVREEAGRKTVKELTGRDPEVSLDPTLLLSPKDWEKLTENKQEGPYHLLYLMQEDTELINRAKEAAEKDGVPLKAVTSVFMPRFGFSAFSGVGVNDWVGLFHGASAVFTNSFHGTAFALMYGKPLLACGTKGGLSKRGGRLEELLKSVGLPEAYGEKLSSLPEGAFEERIKERREASVNYLKEIISHAAAL